jgi:hypothetical protein
MITGSRRVVVQVEPINSYGAADKQEAAMIDRFTVQH